MRGRSSPSSAHAASGPRPLNRADVEAFLHIAADADGYPVPDALRVFAAGAIDDVLRLDGDRLVVLGISGPRYYPPLAVRDALVDARRTWTVIHPGPASTSPPEQRRPHGFW